jgi:addiction module HigA family antidote
MTMHNPPSVGEIIKEIYIEELGLSQREIAKNLKVNFSTFNRLLNGKSNLTPQMAIKLSAVLGRSPESWLALQSQYSIWNAKQSISLEEYKMIA